MIIAVPIREGRFSSHFGGAEEFAFYTVNEKRKEVANRATASPPEHGRGVFPVWLAKQGATTVLAGGMGPRASGILAGQGIEVVLGADGDDPDAMVRAFLDGTLSFSGELCSDHGFHDCGHGIGGGCGSQQGG